MCVGRGGGRWERVREECEEYMDREGGKLQTARGEGRGEKGEGWKVDTKIKERVKKRIKERGGRQRREREEGERD